MTEKLKYREATANERNPLFNMMMKEAGDYLGQALAVLKLTAEEFKRLFQSVGSVFLIVLEKRVIGFYWIENRLDILHIHALVIKPKMQSKGIGTAVMTYIEDNVADNIDTIEVGIHETNTKALTLCMKRGFIKVRHREDVGFIIYNKSIGTH